MLGPVARISNQLGRNVMLKSIRHGSHGGIPGEVSIFYYVTFTCNMKIFTFKQGYS